MSKRASRKRRDMIPPWKAIQASDGPKSFSIRGASEPLEIEAAAEGESSKPKKFSMVAYTGAAMKVGYGWPVVVDLAGIKVPSQTTPIFRDHDSEKIVGHTTKVEVTAQRIKVAGVMSGEPADVDPIISTAGRGFPWQASIGADVDRMEFVDREETVKVNGRSFTGPIYVARATTLGEVSFVPLGADMATSATVAASKGESAMNPFEKWLAAKGFDPAVLTDTMRQPLEAQFKSETNPPPSKTETPNPEPKVEAGAKLDDFTASRKSRADEIDRCREINRICASYDNPEITVKDGDEEIQVSLEAHAVKAGWDVMKVENQALRAERKKWTDGVGVKRKRDNAPIPGEVLEAALCMSRALPNVEKKYKAEVLEAADKNFRNLGPQQLILMAAAANGYSVGPGVRISQGNIREVMRHAFGYGIQAASGFSTLSLPGILGNVANKEILAGYMEEDQTWREIAAIKSASNFHQVSHYRMLDDMAYEKLPPAGEIKHGALTQESYTSQIHTYAKMFVLTRQDIINDNLGAFDDLRVRIGRGSAMKFNDVFWTEFLSEVSTFWTTARGNYIEGATTTLLSDGVGLTAALTQFRKMKSPTADGAKRIGGRPEILLVPPELEHAANLLYVGNNTTSVKASDANLYANKYKPVVSAWLSDSAITNYSTTAWWLLRSPSIAPAMVVTFLNGNQTPTVESAEADFNTLGVQFRGYHDWGTDLAEYLAGVRSKGAA